MPSGSPPEALFTRNGVNFAEQAPGNKSIAPSATHALGCVLLCLAYFNPTRDYAPRIRSAVERARIPAGEMRHAVSTRSSFEKFYTFLTPVNTIGTVLVVCSNDPKTLPPADRMTSGANATKFGASA